MTTELVLASDWHYSNVYFDYISRDMQKAIKNADLIPSIPPGEIPKGAGHYYSTVFETKQEASDAIHSHLPINYSHIVRVRRNGHIAYRIWIEEG